MWSIPASFHDVVNGAAAVAQTPVTTTSPSPSQTPSQTPSQAPNTPTITTSPNRSTELQNQIAQNNHQLAISNGFVPVGNGNYIHQSQLTPDMLAAYQARVQQQAQQIYPSNPVFGNSSFAQNHPTAAGVISNILLGASRARPGMTPADSVGVVADMALAPGQYQNQIAQERARYVNGQVGNFVNQQKSLSDIDEANARTGYYGSQADYEQVWKGQLAQNKMDTDNATAALRKQGQLDRMAQFYTNRAQQLQEFQQRESTQRYIAQYRALHPAAQANQDAIALRNFQTHLDGLDQQEARDMSRPSPLTGMPLTPDEKQAIHENYEQARQGERDTFAYLHNATHTQTQANTSSSTPSRNSTPSTSNPSSNAPPVSSLKQGIHTSFRNGQTWTLGPNNQPQRLN